MNSFTLGDVVHRLVAVYCQARESGDGDGEHAKSAARAEIEARKMSSHAAVLDVYLQLLSLAVAEYAMNEVKQWIHSPSTSLVMHVLICVGLTDGGGRACCYSEFVRRRVMSEVRSSHGAHTGFRVDSQTCNVATGFQAPPGRAPCSLGPVPPTLCAGEPRLWYLLADSRGCSC